ncbi:hypothetical protein DLAC_01785 [Tieghemostelium lacteum]|uniref:Uncharacterized protein n=1 Tax=Tieghemostelium lacteum TaxID=361077 RepID=A0A152A6C3_TIELA|nr:hypothetical protein DLAC_01785 [Tieghemostelium lacteum]|eukprot:KYR01773.1 hypothetical protein DLAC_01785 [Tieghemostelium lacteum]
MGIVVLDLNAYKMDISDIKEVPSKVKLSAKKYYIDLIGTDVWSNDSWKSLSVLKIELLRIEKLGLKLQQLKSLTKLTLINVHNQKEDNYYQHLFECLPVLDRLQILNIVATRGFSSKVNYVTFINFINSLRNIKSIKCDFIDFIIPPFSKKIPTVKLEPPRFTVQPLEKLKFRYGELSMPKLNKYSMFRYTQSLKQLILKDCNCEKATDIFTNLVDYPFEISIHMSEYINDSTMAVFIKNQKRLKLRKIDLLGISINNAAKLVECNMPSLKEVHIQLKSLGEIPCLETLSKSFLLNFSFESSIECTFGKY